MAKKTTRTSRKKATSAGKKTTAVIEAKAEEVITNVNEPKPDAAEETVAAADTTTPSNDTVDMETETASPATEGKRRGGAFPLVLGGLVAGGIGFGAATYLPEITGQTSDEANAISALSQKSADQDNLIKQLQQKLDEVSNKPVAPDLSEGLGEANLQLSNLSSELTNVSSTVSALSDRISVLEKRPMNDAVSPEAVEAYQAELETLKAAVNLQQEKLQSVAEEATAQIEAARKDAERLEVTATEISQNGVALAAAARIQAALESGAAYSSVLAELTEVSDIEIPAVISDNADAGVATIVALQADFPEIARSALANARASEGPAEGESGIASFFKSQLGVRSLEPQEGNSADAILSRAQFAVKEARLNDALAEVDSLPDSAKSEFSEWKSRAQTRANALAAADAISAALTQN